MLEPVTQDRVTAVVLAGGLGRRMSTDGRGIDKAQVRFRGRPLIEHVIAAIRPQVGAVFVNAAPGTAAASMGLPLCPDRIAGRPGPLAGIHAALSMMDTPWLVSVPCDTPSLPGDLVARLLDTQARTGADRVSVTTATQSHPIIALVHGSLADELEAFLLGGGRKVEHWLSQGRWAQSHFAEDEPFVNLNTADELRFLEQGS